MHAVRRASLTLAVLLAAACSVRNPVSASAGLPEMPLAWRAESFSGSTPALQVFALRREATPGPALFRLLVIPGSGCTGFAPIAARYFSGLTTAQVIVLHKPHADLFAGAAPTECSPEFLRHDALGSWRDDAIAALRQLNEADSASSLPTIVLGISEGAEIAPYLLPAIANPIGMVLLSATGLDPAAVGEMQAERLGQGLAWARLKAVAESDQPDHVIVEGRSLRYWRDMFGWKLTAALAAAKLPLLRAWGDADALLPPRAYEKLGTLPEARGMQVCDWRLAGADHGLQGPRGDGVQLLWANLEAWAKKGRLDCARDIGRPR